MENSLLLILITLIVIIAAFMFLAYFVFFNQLRTTSELRLGQEREAEIKIPLSFHWTLALPGQKKQKFQFDIQVDLAAYKSYLALHGRNFNIWQYHNYAADITPEIESLASHFTALADLHQHKRYELLCNVLSFVQSCIVYTADTELPGRPLDFPKYPLETLVEAKGDCEDQVILGAAILAYLGFDVAVLMSPTHAALGVANLPALQGRYVLAPSSQTAYFYTEMTAKGWLPGEVPDNFKRLLNEDRLKALPVRL